MLSNFVTFARRSLRPNELCENPCPREILVGDLLLFDFSASKLVVIRGSTLFSEWLIEIQWVLAFFSGFW